MTASQLEPVGDLARFMTPEALAEVRRRQRVIEEQEIVVPENSPLSLQQASRMTDSQWRRAFSRAGQAMVAAITEHQTQEDGTEIAAMIFDRLLDLHSYGMTLFAGSAADPKREFREKAAAVLLHVWNDLHRTIRAGLEEAEPLIRAEYQEQLDAYLKMVDQANTEITAERRRADLAEKTIGQLKAQHLNDVDTAVWRAGQAAKTEMKAMQRRAETAERQAQDTQTELGLLRQEVARLSGRERELVETLRGTESRLADAQHNLLFTSFRKESEEKPVPKEKPIEIPSTFAPLDGMTLAVHLRQRGQPVRYDPNTRTLDRGTVSLDVIALCVQDCAAISDKTAFLRKHLWSQGLLT